MNSSRPTYGLSDFSYPLPRERIAQHPLEERDSSRLMVLLGEEPIHRRFREIEKDLEAGDLLVLNDSRVIPGRLRGRKGTGGRVEALFLRRLEGGDWEALLRGKGLRSGTAFELEGGLRATVVDRQGGKARLALDAPERLPEVLGGWGRMPLPPYIKAPLREPERYQTVYAQKEGSIATPTAGLHFTEELLQRLAAKGVEVATLTLHVGLGTFSPIRSEDLGKHRIDAEYFEVPPRTAEAIRHRKGRLIAVGTTTLKTLEAATDGEGRVQAVSGWCDLFIYPPYPFRCRTDGLITNFHPPKSTPLVLLYAYGGAERVRRAYATALREGYRFCSFGDAMLISPSGGDLP
jgi:S-adenosylmethionine:tRNA ribosyltransferase-isomerase